MRNDFKQALTETGRNFRRLRDRLFADLTLGLIDDPAQADFVSGIVDHAQIGNHIPDFFPLIEAQTAKHSVRYTGFNKTSFQCARLGIHAIQNSKIGELSGGGLLQNLLGNILRFPHLVNGRVNRDRLSLRILCPKRFSLTLHIVRNDSVGCIENRLGGTVILFQTNGAGIRKRLFKAQNVFNGCTAEFINTLIVIADNTEIAAAFREEFDEQILCVVGILVLVHHNIAELVLEVFQNIRAILQEADGIGDEIVKIHRIRFRKPLLIELVRLTNQRKTVVAPGSSDKLIRRYQIILGTGNFAQNCLMREHLVLNLQNPLTILHQTLRIVRIINGKMTGITEAIPKLTEETGAGGMEGRSPDFAPLLPKHGRQTVLEFACRFICEGDGKNLPRAAGMHRHVGARLLGQGRCAVKISLHSKSILLR